MAAIDILYARPVHFQTLNVYDVRLQDLYIDVATPLFWLTTRRRDDSSFRLKNAEQSKNKIQYQRRRSSKFGASEPEDGSSGINGCEWRTQGKANKVNIDSLRKASEYK